MLSVLLLGFTGCPESGGGECTTDRDCPSGRFCRQSACVFDCVHDRECPEGFNCTARGRCERGCAETNGGVEACDGLDNDCDDQVDEDFADLGQACANGSCAEGLWACEQDGSGVRCDGPQPAADDSACNGADDDCDGLTDEDAPPVACELQQGVCAGAQVECQAGVYPACDYGPDYTSGSDTSCDGLDTDCDGLTDEDGVMVFEAETGPAASDGIDNNCNGLTDEPGGVMVPMLGDPPKWIDAYETSVFENADCTGVRYGEASADYPATWPATVNGSIELYACSLEGLLPSAYLSWHQARRACEAQGKRLCTAREFGSSCNNGQSTWFPYGQGFVPGGCNDAIAGEAQALPTGAKAGCTAGNGTFDMSGNLAEWLADWDQNRAGQAHLGGWSYACTLIQEDASLLTCNLGNQIHLDTLEWITDCNLQQGHSYESYPLEGQQAFIGTRCCMDGPP